MRNNNVRIAKYSYIDGRNVNKLQHGPFPIPKKQKRNVRIPKYLILLFFLGTFLLYKLYNQECKKFISDIFTVSDIRVIGNERLSKKEVIKELDIILPANLIDLNYDQLISNLKSNKLIKTAEIKLTLPNQINIILTERKPYALWFNGSSFSLIDSEGFVLKDSFEFNAKTNNYLIVAGLGANERINELIDCLKGHYILEQLHSAQLIGNRRWNIMLKNGLIIKLPEDNIRESFLAFKIVLNNYSKNQAFSVVDLRLAPYKIYVSF